MPTIYDPYGNVVSSQSFVKAAAQNWGDRKWEPIALNEIDKLIPQYNLAVLMSASRRMFMNNPLLKAAVRQKGSFSVGSAWDPRFLGEDKEWGRTVGEWLKDSVFPLMDSRGPNFFWTRLLRLWSYALDREGDFLILKVKPRDETDYPKIHHVPGWRMTNGETGNGEVIDKGRYKGARIRNGVIINRYDRPVAYRYLKNLQTRETIEVSTRDAWHVYNPMFFDQYRGLPDSTASLNDLRDSLQAHEWELRAQMIESGISLIEYNETGLFDPDDPANVLGGSTTHNGDEVGITHTEVDGGIMRYFRSNSGSKIESFEHKRPGNPWETFQDRTFRLALAGLNWPFSMVWKWDGLNGTSQRQELSKARQSVEDRQADLISPARWVCSHFVAAAVNRLGMFPEQDDWYRWGFSMPAKLSIDPGRESAIFEKEWQIGSANVTDRVEEKGSSLEDHYRERAHEIALRKRIAREVSEETGEDVSDGEMSQPNKPTAIQ